MSGYRGHLVGGAVTFVGTYLLVSILKMHIPINPLQLLLFTLFGSLFPDIDTKSKVQIMSYRLAFVIGGISLYLQYWSAVAIMGVLLLIPLIVHHRTLTHKKWFIMAIPIALYTFSIFYYPRYAIMVEWNGFFFVMGAFSHLVLDYGFKRALRR